MLCDLFWRTLWSVSAHSTWIQSKRLSTQSRFYFIRTHLLNCKEFKWVFGEIFRCFLINRILNIWFKIYLVYGDHGWKCTEQQINTYSIGYCKYSKSASFIKINLSIDQFFFQFIAKRSWCCVRRDGSDYCSIRVPLTENLRSIPRKYESTRELQSEGEGSFRSSPKSSKFWCFFLSLKKIPTKYI